MMMDLISELPPEIKHRIIYFLPARYAARTSVLSKSWYSAWWSRPALEFTDRDIFGAHNLAVFLDQSLHRFVEREVSTDSLLLSMSLCRPPTAAAITRFISAAALRELTIRITNRCCKITVPSSKTLTALTLSGIDLKVGASGEFPLLRSISLKNMTLDSGAVEELVSNSPLLEILTISGSPAVVDLHRVPRLKRLDVTLNLPHFSLAVNAPKLESFACRGLNGGASASVEIKLQGCEATLKELSLVCLRFRDGDWVQNQVSKMGAVEGLNIEDISGLERLRIVSTKLARLTLTSCDSLSESDTEIYAPNLAEIYYVHNMFPFYSLSGSSRQLRTVKFWFEIAKAAGLDWFTPLKHLFEKVGHLENVVVKIACSRPRMAIVHRGLDNDLFWMLCRLDNSVLDMFVTISNAHHYFNWLWFLFRDTACDDLRHVFVADPQLAEHLSKEMPGIIKNHDTYKYAESYDVDVLNENGIHLRGGGVDAETKTALSFAYGDQTPFRYTRFTINWPPY